MSRRALAVASALLLAAPAASAAGPSSQSAPALARAAFAEGRAAMKAGDLPRACARFADAHRLDANVGYAVNLARCEEKRDELVRARQHWQEALDLARARADARAAEVEAGLEAVDARVPRLVIVPTEPVAHELAVRLDDVLLESTVLRAPIPVDPGLHRVVASAPGRKDWSTSLTVSAHETKVTLPVLEAETPVVVTPAASAPVAPPPPPRAAGSTQRKVAVVAGAAGVAGLVVGTIFGLRAASKQSSSEEACKPDKNVCPPEGLALREQAQSAATVSTVSFLAGGVLAAGGVVLWLTAPRNAARSVGLAPAPGGVSLHGRF